MKRRLVKWTLAVLPLLVVWWVLRHFAKSEPTYQGRTASAWFKSYIRSFDGVEGNPELPQHAFQAMGAAVVPFLTNKLCRQESLFEKSFIAVFVRLPEPIRERIVTHLRSNLPVPVQIQRGTALLILQTVGPTFQRAVPALIHTSRTGDPSLRAEAIKALGDITPRSKEASEAVAERLKDFDVNVRIAAVDALSIFALKNLDARVDQFFVEMLRDRTTRINVSAYIGDRKIRATRALPSLLRALNEDEPGLQMNVANALATVGPEANEAVPKLIELLTRRNSELVGSLLNALGKIGPAARPALPIITSFIGGTNENHQLQAALALWRIDRQTNTALKVFCRSLTSTNSKICGSALHWLEEMGTAAESTMPILIRNLTNQSMGNRAGAARPLGLIGSPAKRALPALRTLLRDFEPYVRVQTAEAILRIEPHDQQAMGLLTDYLTNQDFFFWAKPAATALGNLGTIAKAAIPGLMKATNHEDRYLRKAAAEALTKIEERPRVISKEALNVSGEE